LAWPPRPGLEGTGSYGAGLAGYLGDQQVRVVEVDRPDRRTRRQRGKSDPIDAEAAARAALAGVATAVPKRRDGIVEAIRVSRTARSGASKARTAAINQLTALVVTAPAAVREVLDGRPVSVLITSCARLRPDQTGLTDRAHASKAALQAITHRIRLLEVEITWPTSGWRSWSVPGAGRARGLGAGGCVPQFSLGGTYLYVGLIEEAVKLAALWLLVAVAGRGRMAQSAAYAGQRMR
jgi:hypothetical protein